MNKIVTLADPDIPFAVPPDGMHFARHRVDGSEPAIFKEGHSATRRHPNPILKILIEGLDRIIRQSTYG